MNVDLTRQEITDIINRLGDFHLVPKLRRVLETDPAKKSYPITSVAKGDLEDKFHPKLVELLDDDDMTTLARDMADSYMESQQFWTDLEILAEPLIRVKEEGFINNIPRDELPLHINNDWFTDHGRALLERRFKK